MSVSFWVESSVSHSTILLCPPSSFSVVPFCEQLRVQQVSVVVEVPCWCSFLSRVEGTWADCWLFYLHRCKPSTNISSKKHPQTNVVQFKDINNAKLCRQVRFWLIRSLGVRTELASLWWKVFVCFCELTARRKLLMLRPACRGPPAPSSCPSFCHDSTSVLASATSVQGRESIWGHSSLAVYLKRSAI